MNGLTIVSDNSYTRTAIEHLILQLNNQPDTEENLAIFTFEKNWLSKCDLDLIIKSQACRTLIIMKKNSLLYSPEMYLSQRVYFGNYNEPLISLTKLLTHFILDVKTTHLSGLISTRQRKSKLTTNEHKTLLLYVKGFAIQRIANILNISAKTVYSHKLNAMRKMNITNNAELIKRKGEILFTYQFNTQLNKGIFGNILS